MTDKPTFYPLEPLNEHNCLHCKHEAYDISERAYKCRARELYMTPLEHVAPNDCEHFASIWLNDFKHQQATGKGYKSK